MLPYWPRVTVRRTRDDAGGRQRGTGVAAGTGRLPTADGVHLP